MTNIDSRAENKAHNVHWDNNTVAMGSTGEEDKTVTDGNKRLADINYDICVLSSASIVRLSK